MEPSTTIFPRIYSSAQWPYCCKAISLR